MFSIKIKTQKDDKVNVATWLVYSANSYVTDYEIEEGRVIQFIEYEDNKGSYHTIDLKDGMVVFFENMAGRTIQRITVTTDKEADNA